MTSHELFGIRIDDPTTEELASLLRKWLLEDESHVISTPNPEFILLAHQNKDFATILNKSDLSLADGIGLRFAIVALTENFLQHRHTGVDTVELLARLCHEEKKTLLLFGGREGVALRAADSLSNKFLHAHIVALEPIESPSVTHYVEQIAHIRPDVIAVALGQEKQERFIHELLLRDSRIKIAIGVGGAFDTISGLKPRAPVWMRRVGFEWMWRLFLEPIRWKRIMRAVIIFPVMVIYATLKQRRFFRALFRVSQVLGRDL